MTKALRRLRGEDPWGHDYTADEWSSHAMPVRGFVRVGLYGRERVWWSISARESHTGLLQYDWYNHL